MFISFDIVTITIIIVIKIMYITYKIILLIVQVMHVERLRFHIMQSTLIK